MRILILTCATGGGHLRAAAALENTYAENFTTHEVIQMGLLKSIGKLFDANRFATATSLWQEDPVSSSAASYKTTNKDNFADFVPCTTELLGAPALSAFSGGRAGRHHQHPFATEMILQFVKGAPPHHLPAHLPS